MERRSPSLAVLALTAALGAPAAAFAAPGDTTLVNRSPMGSGDAWGEAFGHALTADGSTATFTSADGRYVFDDGADYDVFVRDLGKGTTAAFGGERGSQTHDLSADGRWLAFASDSRSIEQEAEEDLDLYLRDGLTGETRNIGHLTRGEGTQSNPHRPAISADGGRVVYQSSSGVIVLYDRVSDTGRILERYLNERECSRPVISANGNTVAYDCTWSDGDRTKGGVYVWNLREPAPRRIGLGAEPRLSADGRFVVWGTDATESHGIPDDNALDVVITDLQTGKTDLVSYPPRDNGTGRLFAGGLPAAVSADGRYVFLTALSNESAEFTCCDTPVVVDRVTGHVEPVARPDGLDGPVSGGWARDMTADGRFVLFDSADPALDAQKRGDQRSVYVRELPVRGGAPAPQQPAAGTPTPPVTVAPISRRTTTRTFTSTNGLTLRVPTTLVPDRRGRITITVRNTTRRTLSARLALRSPAGRRLAAPRTVRLRARTSTRVRLTLTRAARRTRTQRATLVASRRGAKAETRAAVTLRVR